ncbi:MAG: arginine--tRNA ligase [Clostridia bacterium]
MDHKLELANAIGTQTGIPAAELVDYIEIPPNPEMGDYAFPCFRLAKSLKKAPAAIAAQLKDEVQLPGGIARVEAAGGYLNFFANKDEYTKAVLDAVLSADRYGATQQGENKNVCIEFSSINIAKPVHIGHLSSTAIGNSLCRIYGYLGYNTIAINHLGDWGTQFGKMIVAYQKWGSREMVEKESVRGLVKLYVRFHEEAEKDESLNDEARAWFRKIELGDPDALELFNWFKEISLKEVMQIYELLDVHFDSYAGESFFEDKMKPIIDELGAKGLLKVDNGATLVELEEYGMPPCIILRSDGATLYATRDLAAARYRKATYNFVKSLYVVAYQQNLHFQQFFKVLELLGDDWVKDMEHVNFGMVSMEEGTLSTRHGNVVYLEDVLKAAIDKTLDIIKEKSPDLEDKQSAARAVGVGAVVWGVLYNSRIKDITFSWGKVLNFDGETGPYAQYTHARCCSVLNKAGGYDANAVDYSKLDDPAVAALVKTIAVFPDAIQTAASKNEPYIVARATIDICATFNRFYYDNRIMDDDAAIRNARLAITDAARKVIATGLYLVGLKAPERM